MTTYLNNTGDNTYVLALIRNALEDVLSARHEPVDEEVEYALVQCVHTLQNVCVLLQSKKEDSKG
jgi:hypothetical protein